MITRATAAQADVASMPSATKRYAQVPNEARLWFVDFHAYHARVHGKSIAYSIRQLKRLAPQLFEPVDGTTEARPSLVAATRPFTSSAARLSLSAPTWRHVYRRVLGALELALVADRRWTGTFPTRAAVVEAIVEARGDLYPRRPSEADIARERRLLAGARHLLARSPQDLAGPHMEPRRGSCAYGSHRRA